MVHAGKLVTGPAQAFDSIIYNAVLYTTLSIHRQTQALTASECGVSIRTSCCKYPDIKPAVVGSHIASTSQWDEAKSNTGQRNFAEANLMPLQSSHETAQSAMLDNHHSSNYDRASAQVQSNSMSFSMAILSAGSTPDRLATR